MDIETRPKCSMISRMKCEEPFPEADVGDDNQQSKAPYRSRSLSDLYSVHCPVEMASQDTSASSQAIIPVSPAPSDMGALAIVPLCKSKRSEIGQRRIRRPFTVGEVETLVGAVEQLGTGRSVSNEFVSVVFISDHMLAHVFLLMLFCSGGELLKRLPLTI